MSSLLVFADRTVTAADPSGANFYLVAIPGLLAVVVVGFLAVMMRAYKRCPSNRVLVIFGRRRAGDAAQCIHGGAHFVKPLLEDYDWLHLDPMQIEIPLRVRFRRRTSASTYPASSRWPSAPRPN